MQMQLVWVIEVRPRCSSSSFECDTTAHQRGNDQGWPDPSTIYNAYAVLLAGKSPNIWIHQIYGYLRCIHTVLASPRVTQQKHEVHVYPYTNTVYTWYSWQGNHQIYGHLWCIHTVLDSPRVTQQ